ncbi:metal-dependent transcriptional regulator [Sphingobacterium sp. lm-10]|uniref:metal-dependent transcriptional regulator n=1 Tax=Sphingobacterium sp. lm-10 TaxID=2944904 RepID=UPI0020222397|nr:metal-dependent transcriptional regulator [Sphingobacterium sp. lm-10]MCL7986644.1 metal-dependent transcriptional regulator [Sphingobacterium sp. lm-10]
MYSIAEENYLKSLFNLANEHDLIQLKEIGKLLDVKMSSVTNMMKRFADKGLVHYENYKPVKLTENGKREAALIIRKHRLTEMYLVEKMGFGWEKVHNIAEQIEHIHASDFFDKMDEILGFPTVDPHGSPIPDKDGKIVRIQHKTLSECKIGDKAKLMAVRQSSSDFLSYLNSRELYLGETVEVEEIESFDGTMKIVYSSGRKESLSKKVCDMLLVR